MARDPDERSSVPTPVSAAVGLAVAYVDGLRRLPMRAATLPVRSAGLVVQATLALRNEYAELAARGDDVLGRLPWLGRDAAAAAAEQLGRAGEQVDAFAGEVERLAGRATGVAADAVEGTVGGAASAAGAAVDSAAGATAGLRNGAEDVAEAVEVAGSAAAGFAQDAYDAAAAPGDRPADELADTDAPRRHDSAVSSEVEEQVELVAAEFASAAPVTKQDLPLPDFDHLTLGALRARLRRLEVEDLVVLRDYEKAHANRLPVVTMLDNRIAKLAADAQAGSADSGAPAAPPVSTRS